jgi:hypothetical protein
MHGVIPLNAGIETIRARCDTLASAVRPHADRRIGWQGFCQARDGRRRTRGAADAQQRGAGLEPGHAIHLGRPGRGRTLIRFSSCFHRPPPRKVGPSGGRHQCDPELRHSQGRADSTPPCEGTRSRATRSRERQGDVGRRARRSERGCRLPQSAPAAVGSCPFDEHGQTPESRGGRCAAQRRSGAGGSLPGLEPTDTELRLSGS